MGCPPPSAWTLLFVVLTPGPAPVIQFVQTGASQATAELTGALDMYPFQHRSTSPGQILLAITVNKAPLASWQFLRTCQDG